MAENSRDKIILPEKYYYAYFEELLRFVQKHSGHLIDEPSLHFISDFFSLSEDARCLFVRMCNRRGQFFRPQTFQYPEIASIEGSLDELYDRGFCDLPDQPDTALLRLFRKDELVTLFQPPREIAVSGKNLIIEYISSYNFLEDLISYEPVVRLQKQEEVAYLRMLFFGNIHTEMTEFVIRDVGHVKLQTLDTEGFKPWFVSIEEARAMYDISKSYGLVKEAMSVLTAMELHDLMGIQNWHHYKTFPTAARIADKLLQSMGAQLEREKQPELALYYYQQASRPPARERCVRLLMQLGQQNDAENLAQQMVADPLNAAERIFASDFLAKKQIRIRRSTTQRIKNAHTLTIQFIEGRNVESLALERLEKQGYQGAHVENRLWRNLFGLVFWDILFDQSSGNFHHPLQRVSDNLFDKSFYQSNELQLRQILKKLKSSKNWKAYLKKNHEKYFGISNPLVGWEPGYFELLELTIDRIMPKKLAAILLAMAENVRDNSTGFPDLFVWNETDYMFYEVKSPNDQLSAQQLFWLDFFHSIGVNAEVLRLNYSKE